jgi:hypothetical protein
MNMPPQSLDSIKRLTFAKIEAQQGCPAHEDVKDGWPLEMWYQAVRKTPLGELSLEDICKACRQQVFLEQIIPLALEQLSANPLAGELYDGELLNAFESTPERYWKDHVEQARKLIDIVCGQSWPSKQAARTADRLLAKLQAIVA